MSAPSVRSTYLRQGMSAIGFGDELLATGFRRSTSGSANVLELVGFGVEEPKDTSTAVAVAEEVGAFGDSRLDELFDAANDLAAPIILAGSHDAYQLFASSTRELIVSDSWSQVGSLADYRDALAPSRLLDAKRGTRQLGLFPVPVEALTNARRSQRVVLGQVISDLLADLGAGSRILRLPNMHGYLDRQRLAYRCVGSALCAMVLVDKTGSRGSVEQILQVARERVASLFDWFTDETHPGRDMLVHSIEVLSASIDFRKFDTNVLSRVYEEVLVDPDQRRLLGIHYTPVEIAEKLLSSLPIEDIRPEDRYVLDPACGSGTLLVSAHDRLTKLQPAYWDRAARHDDLRSRLRGRDRDPLAVELSRLALVLHAVPAGNGWQIEEGDSLNEQLYRAETLASSTQEAPSIIVANPPFELPVNDGARLDIAVRFVDIILRQLRAGGIFGIVLPASWLSGTGLTRASRENVQRACEIFEMWRLPRDTFSLSRASTIVLFGRKLESGQKRSYTRGALHQRVPRVAKLDMFYSGLDYGSLRYVGDPFARTGSLSARLSDNTSLIPILSVATPRTGAQPLPGHLDQARAGEIRDDGVRWLPQLGRLPQFAKVPDEVLLSTSWPEGFLRKIKQSDIRSPKVLIGTQATEDSPWIRLLLDEDGILASKSLLWLVPNVGRLIARSLDAREAAFALLAISGSSLMSAWLDEASTGRNVRGSDMQRFLVPRNEAAWKQFAEIGSELTRKSREGEITRQYLQALDQAVFKAYGFDDDDPLVSAVVERLAGVPDPALAGEARYLYQPRAVPTAPADPIECEGTVLDVSSTHVQIRVPGVTGNEGVWIPIPARFPGHLCEAQRHFSVQLGDDDDLFEGRYSLHSSAWSSSEEVVRMLQERQVAVSDG